VNTSIDSNTHVKLTIPQAVGCIILIVAMCGNWFSTKFGLDSLGNKMEGMRALVIDTSQRVSVLEKTVGNQHALTRSEIDIGSDEATSEARRARLEAKQAREAMKQLQQQVKELSEQVERQRRR
jgi:hypothetical protein